MSKIKNLSYRDAGVDIQAGQLLVDHVQRMAGENRAEGVVAGIGGFGAVFDPSALAAWRHPLLVASTDGVGTKLELAERSGSLHGIGIDLVAMCANDVLAQGARPIFFLDYLACGRLCLETAKELLSGITEGCGQADMVLVGGETAEMPGRYPEGAHDLAGFCVGIVERDRLLNGTRVQPGQPLIALASSGAHANGYSLIRHLSGDKSWAAQPVSGWPEPLNELLEPTQIYVRSVRPLLDKGWITGIAHITGGGLMDNIPRFLPDHMGAVIDADTWSWPPLFEWIAAEGHIRRAEMYRTFNCGIGMVLSVFPEQVDDAVRLLNESGQRAWRLGQVQPLAPGENPVQGLD